MLDLKSIENGIEALGKAVNIINKDTFFDNSDDMIFIIKSGVVQHFEFTYELCWKYMKRMLGELAGAYMTDGLSRKELFRMSAEYGLIDNPDSWFAYHEARNLTSHTYNQFVADEVVALALKFHKDAQKLLDQLKIKND